ncbi:MAG TPA: response regulator [Anaerolineae bacterium]|nr:response regulator [Anaerolineae bacterium]
MIVDDEVNIRTALKYRLKKEGYSVLLAVDGLEALDKVASERPDLIILDLMLPRMDGYQVLERLKGDPRTADIPVIVLTARGGRGDRARSLELGAASFVAKPFSPRQLVAEVKRALGDAD